MTYAEIVCTVIGIVFIFGACTLAWAVSCAADDDAGVIDKE